MLKGVEMNSREKGNLYETKAMEYLKLRGLKFLERNVRGSFGEVDLIFLEDKAIVFVEVKYRSTKDFGFGAEAVDKRKAKRIYLTAMEYIREKRLDKMEARFDLITFDNGKLEWTRNIIWGDSFGV